MNRPTLTLLVNPAAGRGKAARRLPQVVQRLRVALPDRHIEVVTTSGMANARVQAEVAVRQAAHGGALVVMGGDGMASVGLNACADTEVPLGIIPAGTGNDFCRGAGLPTSISAAVATIGGRWARRIDLMKVSGDLNDGSAERFVGSVVSTGFDERVNWRTNNLPFSIGTPSYLFTVLAELRSFEPLRYELTIDGVPRSMDAMLVAVGNAGMFGGGMRICPNADVTDGLLDVTIVRPVSRPTLLRLLPSVFTGGFVGHPAAELLRVERITVDGPKLHGMADGEELGRPPFDCAVARSMVSVFSPR